LTKSIWHVNISVNGIAIYDISVADIKNDFNVT